MTSFVSAYFDDIAIFSATEEEHYIHVQKVLNRLVECNLRINFSKCQWFRPEVEFLGHLITKDGIKPIRRKIKYIVSFDQLQFVDELRRFLGLAGYYRKFVPNFASTASPLYQLLKKNRTCVWTRECDLAFLAIKQVLQRDTAEISGFREHVHITNRPKWYCDWVCSGA